MRFVPRLAALATAVPQYPLDQEAVTTRAARLFSDAPNFARLLPVFANSGIHRRYSAMPLDWFDLPHDWPERNRHFLANAVDLLETAARRALDRAGVAPSQIGAVVAVSTTGIATPSLDALIAERLRLAPEVRRLPIFGLGCAGGAIGLGHAATLATTMPDRAALLLVAELCTLSFRLGDFSKSSIVSAALFGDGAAAAVIRADGTGPKIVASGEHTWPESLNIMGWEVATDGLQPIFSRDIPRLVAGRLRAAAIAFLLRHGRALGEIDRFVCHPGGPKVIDACEAALGLASDTLADERAVLRDFGNMSAPSVLFVLERLLRGGERWRRALLTALGPGFTAGFVMLENA
jgi:alkylresorcinol/alkylpyrone synthase